MWVEKTKNGVRYVERYKDLSTGKVKKVSVSYQKDTPTNKRNAKKELNEKIKKKNKVISQNKTTLNELYQDFVKEKEQTNKKSTMEFYYRFSKIISEKDILLSEINQSYCKNLYTGKDSNAYKIFKTFLLWCYNNFYTERDFSVLIKAPKPKKLEIKEKMYLEKEELNSYLEDLRSNATKKGATYRAKVLPIMVEFMALTGLRLGETIALEDKDLNGIELIINKTYDDDNKIITEPKTKSSNRVIIVNDRTLDLFKEQIELKKTYMIKSDILFSGTFGGYFSSTGLRHALKKSSSKYYGFHILRHTHASLLAEKGIPLDVIQRRLGHESDVMTKKIYIHITEKQKNKEKNIFKNLELF